MVTNALGTGLLLFCAFGGLPATGAVLTYSDVLPPATTNWTGTFTLPKFDAATFGTLNGVVLTLNGEATSNIFLESLDASPATIQASSGTQIVASTPLGPIMALAVNPVTFNASAFDGVNDFGGTSGRSFIGLDAHVLQSLGSTAPADLAMFTGLGSFIVNVTFTGQSMSSGAGNLLAFFQTMGGGRLSVAYDFDSGRQGGEVPEPASTLLVGCGLLLLGLRLKAR